MDVIEWLKHRWFSSGIENGDIVLIHSNSLRTLSLLKRNGYRPSVKDVLQSFIAAVGEEGTLLFPLFNFDFTTGQTFDIRYTKSQMGALTEEARKHPEAVRTGHPVYSFCAIGALASKFKGVDNVSGYGVDSPFGMLHQLNGKIAVLDIPENESVTFHHYVEERMSVPYRYMKNFIGDYIDLQGIKSQKTYSIYVRDLERKVRTNLQPIGEKLWNASIYTGDYPNINTGLRVASADALFDYVSKVIIRGDALDNLYCIGE